MKTKILIGGVIIIAILAIGARLFYFSGEEGEKNKDIVNNQKITAQSGIDNLKSSAINPKNAAYTIEGQKVTLVNGVSIVPIAPNAASMVTTRYFGNEVSYDFNHDGRPDTAFILSQNTGGSGTFYYVVVALNTERGYVGSIGYLLGDRIAPQSTYISRNTSTPDVLVVNYADRKAGESFATSPSTGKSLWLKLDTTTLQLHEIK